MKKLISLTFLFVLAFASVAFAQDANRTGSKKFKPISIEEATALANDTLATLEGYSLKEIKVLERKGKKSAGVNYEAVLNDRDGYNQLSLVISHKGYIKCITLSEQVGTMKGKKGKMANKTPLESSAEAEKVAMKYLEGYKGFVIGGVDEVQVRNGKAYNFTILDSYKNKYYLMVGSFGIAKGLITEDAYNKRKAFMQEKWNNKDRQKNIKPAA